MPCGTSGYCAYRCALLAVKPSTDSDAGRDIDSTPPPITHSWWPARMPIAATVTACWPDPQNRCSETPGVVTGQPASSTDMRAMSIA